METKTNHILNSLNDVDFSKLNIPMAVVYENPSDFPGKTVIRVWEALIPEATNIVIIYESLKECRMDVENTGYTVKLLRSRDDDACIVESYMF